ncbi:RNA ligase family protein [Streptomyces sp. NPDC001407]|uniref:RNA ligase family protein n=1 Tax=Streptomyces sp. NPDC001407 TaxID=3364573 RepID=UPI0036A23393
MRSIDLESLNSATKYPSILTFHERAPKGGVLLDTATPFEGDVVLTEKVDGTNSRIIVFPDGSYIIGSREELLYARGDLIANPKEEAIAALRPVADGLAAPDSGVRVLYLEVYGGKIGSNARQYTGQGRVGFRMFDAATIPEDILNRTPAEVSAWRERGGQAFWPEKQLRGLSAWEGIELTPRLGLIPAAEVPTGIEEMRDFLISRLPETQVALDADGGRRPEGIVLRTQDRTVIAKARLADYERTLRHYARL